jgi:hypothetical protein
MRNAFLHGLVFGLGFAIAATAIVVLAAFGIPWDKAASQQSAAFDESSRSAWAAGGVVVANHEEVARGDDVVFLGAVKNQGQTVARGFRIEVELFDQNKKFVDICSESLFGPVKPGETRRFKISCGGCRDKQVPQHSSYEIRVRDGL